MNKLLKKFLRFLAPRFFPTTVASSDATEHSTTVTLPVHGWRSIAKPAGLAIRCQRGRATITQEGDPRDRLLVTGETYRANSNAHLYVQANTEAELRLSSMLVSSKCV